MSLVDLRPNATVTKIAAPGSAEDYDTPAGTGTTRWQGASAGYVEEKLLEETGGSFDEVTRTKLHVPLDISRRAQRDDTVTFRRQGFAEDARRVTAVQVYDVAGYGVLTLEDE